MKLPEEFFTQVALGNNLIVGGPIRINLGNRRYAWHRVTEIKPWYAGDELRRVTIITVELKAGFKDGDHHVWNIQTLINKMDLTTIYEGAGRYSIHYADHWEHDVLEAFVEQFYIHIN